MLRRVASMAWTRAPDAGGVKISERTRADVQRRFEAYAARHFAGRYRRLVFRFRGAFCYVDAVTSETPRDVPMQLCRLRHFDSERWTLGFFRYSDEKYELCFIDDAGDFWCTPEQGFEVAARAYRRTKSRCQR